MLPLALIFLLIFGSANGNWDKGGNDDSFEGLKFYTSVLECNDAQSECVANFTGKLPPGLPFKTVGHMFKYTKDPYKITFDTNEPNTDVMASFNQDNPSEKFHVCSDMNEVKIVPVLGWYRGEWTMCLENDFSDLTVPASCAAPVAVSTTLASVNDERMIGQQVLYCLPS